MSWRWLVAALAIATLLTQGLARRPDPAAEPGLRVAVALLISMDAELGREADADGAGVDPAAQPPDAGQRAERAAAVARIWADGSQERRLAVVRDLPVENRDFRFVAQRWVEVGAWADRGDVEVIGHLERREPLESSWQPEPDRLWRVQLSRGDPVGRQRGWRLKTLQVLDAPVE